VRHDRRNAFPWGPPHRAPAVVAAALAVTFFVMASSPALADGVRSQEWWLRTLHVTHAWQTTRGSGVTVALLDTGVDPNQADLAGSVITGPDYTHSGRAPGGPFWGIHGTAMASIIAGHGHGAGNAYGVIGAAPAARILSVRVTLDSGDPLLTDPAIAGGLPNAIARGIKYAVRQHAAVIDLPLDPVTTPGTAGSGGSPAERAAVAYALAHRVVLVAPAGDEGTGTDAVNYPAAYPGVISVGAFNKDFVKAPYSSHQPYVTLTAAGDGVTAASEPAGYAPVFSTSAASAVVAGIVALIKALFPALTPAQVRQALITSTVFRPRGGRKDGSGYGTVDAAAALTAASTLAEAVPSAAASAGAVAGPAAPSAPAVHSTVIRKNLGHSLITDAGIAVALFLVLLGCILGFTMLRRRRARSARLAEVRAATRVPARKPVSAGEAASATAGSTATTGNATWPPDSTVTAGAGTAGAAAPGAGVPGAGVPGAGAAAAAVSGAAMSGTGFTGAGLSGTWRPVPAGAQDGYAPGVPGRTPPQPQVEPAGFLPAPLGPDADVSDLAAEAEPPDPGSAGPALGGAPGDPADGSAAVPGAPPWARIQEEPSARFRGSGNAAIPDSAFPGAAAVPGPRHADGLGRNGKPGLAEASSTADADEPRQASPARPPQVSGSPPWEPAPRPESALPWAQTPGPPPGGAGLPQHQPARPEAAPWDSIAQAAWPGGPRAGKPYRAAPYAPGSGSRSGSDPAGPVDSAGSAGLGSHPADWPDNGQHHMDQPEYASDPDTSADPRRTVRPDGGSGFLRGSWPEAAEPQPARFRFLRGTRPARIMRPPSNTRPGAGATPGSAGPGDAGPGGSRPADAAAAGTAPDSSIPPWEITDSFLALRAEMPGSDGAGSPPAALAGPAPDEASHGGEAFPAGPAAPAQAAGSLAAAEEGAAFPEAPATPSAFAWLNELFPPDQPEPQRNTRRRGSSRKTPAEPARSSGSGPSVPATPAGPPDSPHAAPPGNGTQAAGSTEGFSFVPPSAEERLPRRIPPRVRGESYPPAEPRSDDDAFRLFPFGKETDEPPAEPPRETGEG
jgi:Subtilase family